MIRTLPAALSRARRLLAPALRDAVGRLTPEVRRVVAYHLGWTDAQGRPTEDDGGKAVRPALAILSAEAVGAPAERALPGAVAVELVHNFSLLHDDVMDGDPERRHRPTAWVLFGQGQAIVAGDALLALAHEVLIEPPRPERVRAASALAEATAAMIAGQAEDLSFESRPDVSIDECLAMCGRKTAALLSCASRIGAILAGADDGPVGALGAFGFHLGLAFQAIDDVLGIWGRPELTGKPQWSDLRQRKKTLPVVAALEGRGPGGDRLRALLGDGALSDEDLGLAARLVEEAGGREWAMAQADRQLGLALEALSGADVRPEAHRELVAIAEFITAREF